MSMAACTFRGSDARNTRLTRWATVWLAVLLTRTPSAQAPLVLHLEDYATLPVTGMTGGTGNSGSLARVNLLREEPGGADRFFVVDLNGPLYILEKQTRRFSVYLDFNGRSPRSGLFDRLHVATGFANGLISVEFDPDYRQNGRFYTIHLEEPGVPGSEVPDASSVPGLDVAGYTPTPAISTPGVVDRHAVVVEWTDSNITNTTFEGTARELMRVEHNTRIHPMGALTFNPAARPGDPDWRVLYIGCGDGGSGELGNAMRQNPQRLDTLVGKILRIVPDLSLHESTSDISDNGRYRIPRDNPFVAVPGARKEIWAVGLRNPHRLTWDVDPTDPARQHLIASSIGLGAWESVYLIRRGANYGYSEREGHQRMTDMNDMVDLPVPDEIPLRVSDVVTEGTVTPTYPVLAYPHDESGGDAISGGFVYRGTRVPALHGQFVFGDISTGRLWAADFRAMVTADDGNPSTMAARREVRVRWRGPDDAGPRVYPTLYPVALAAYRARGGQDPDMPGGARVSGEGRADIRLAVDAAGELYVLSKSDGMIRAIVGTD